MYVYEFQCWVSGQPAGLCEPTSHREPKVHIRCFPQLLDKGADKHLAGRSRAHGTPLHLAVTSGNAKIVEMLLVAGAR